MRRYWNLAERIGAVVVVEHKPALFAVAGVLVLLAVAGRRKWCAKTFAIDVIRSFRHDRRRFLSPGVGFLFVLIMAFSSFAAWRIQSVQHDQAATQRDYAHNALTGCKRANAQNAALLDLGKIITAARRQTSTSPKVRQAAADYLVQVRRLDQHAPTTKALRDLATLLGGDHGKPGDARVLAAAEDDFIKKAKQIDRPRRCEALYGS